MRISTIIIFFMYISALLFAAAESEQAPSILLWTQEGESEGVVSWIQDLGNRFEEESGVAVEVVSKDTEALREDFQIASLAGNPPDLLWTVNDHAGPFVAAELIDPVEDVYRADEFVESVSFSGNIFGVPISTGNHLMLLYNKRLVSSPPESTDELIEIATSLTSGDTFGLVYNQLEPFWLVPWLGGFGGKVFADDGISPTLDTQAMRDTLQFLYDLKFTHQVVPLESDYGTMDTLFKEGKAAMIVNGDWSLSDYAEVLGDDLGVASLPRVSSTGLMPAPYTSGKYFMIARGVSDEKRAIIRAFIDFVTSEDIQLEMINAFKRLPSRLSSLELDVIESDPILSNSALQVSLGTPMPSVVEMRAVWDAMKPEMNQVLAGAKTPVEAARDMQEVAESGIRALQ